MVDAAKHERRTICRRRPTGRRAGDVLDGQEVPGPLEATDFVRVDARTDRRYCADTFHYGAGLLECHPTGWQGDEPHPKAYDRGAAARSNCLPP